MNDFYLYQSPFSFHVLITSIMSCTFCNELIHERQKHHTGLVCMGPSYFVEVRLISGSIQNWHLCHLTTLTSAAFTLIISMGHSLFSVIRCRSLKLQSTVTQMFSCIFPNPPNVSCIFSISHVAQILICCYGVLHFFIDWFFIISIKIGHTWLITWGGIAQ